MPKAKPKKGVARTPPFVNYPEWEGVYVSADGRVFSSRQGELKELAQTVNNRGKGYFRVSLTSKKKAMVHRMVAETYISNPENKPQVNHKNGNTLDNRVENLEWVTAKENSQHARTTGLQGDKSTPIYGVHLETGDGVWFRSGVEASKFGFSRGLLSQASRGLIPNHKGYEWHK